MKVYLKPQEWMGMGIKRVERALKHYAPVGVTVVEDRAAAEFEVVHVVGWGSLPQDLGRTPFAVMQYCHLTTENSDIGSWMEIWTKARAVWSYYDLPAPNLYHAPLGVDAAVFHANGHARTFKIATHGYVAASEAVAACHRAAARVGCRAAHLGPNLGFGGDVFDGVSDEDVAHLWGSTEYVAALRRVEGFELPAIEGLACGARPVAFDRPHYTRWFGEHAEYVPETDEDTLTTALADVFAKPARPVSEAERAAVIDKFNWQRLVGGFWDRVL